MNSGGLAIKFNSTWRLAVLISLLLAGLTLLVFWPVTRCGFVNFDDPDYVLNNPPVQAGLSWSNAAWAFTTGRTGNWHPMTWLSLMLDATLFGKSAVGFHVTSLMLHAVNVVLLFWLLRSLTGAMWRSALAAALFAWHPLAVESVAWVAERKNVLCTAFGFLSLLFYVKYARTGNESEVQSPRFKVKPVRQRVYYIVCWLALGIGLMSKPMVVTWPFVMLLLDYWPLARVQPGRWRFLVLEKIPFLALVVASSVVTFFVQRNSHLVVAMNRLPLDERVENAIVAYGRYLVKMFWPADLAVFYPHPGSWPLTTGLLAVAGLGAITLLVWFNRSRRPYMVTGWLWYLGTLVPVIGLVQVGGQAMADRYMYIPMVGVLVMVVWGGFELARNVRWGAAVLAVMAAAALVVLPVLSWRQIAYWQNGESLFRRALAVTSNNWLAHYNLGEALDHQGRTDEAMSEYRQAMQCQSTYAEPRNNLGVDLDKQGHTAEAIQYFQQAIQCQPGYVDAWNNLGVVLEKTGRLDEAIGDFTQALQLEPENPVTHKNLGEALDKQGQTDTAIQHYQTALRLNPEYPEACNNLGVDFAREGRFAEAADQFQQALQLRPDDAEAGNNLGYLWTSQGVHLNEALALIQRAHATNPKDSGTLDSLGWVLCKLNRPAEGLEYARQAIHYAPRPDASFYDHLGDIYAALHQRDQAAGAWRQALGIASSPEISRKLEDLRGP